MRHHTLHLPALAALLLFLAAGCASLDPAASFDTVRSDVAKRAGESVHWDRNATTPALQDPGANGLSLREALRIALGSGRLQARFDDLELAQAAVVQAGLPENPIFSGKYQLVEDVGHIWELEAAQSVTSLLLLPLRQDMATAEQRRIERRVTVAALQLMRDVKAAYRNAQAADAMVAIWRKEEHAAKAAYEMAGRIREAGNTTKLDLLLRRTAYEEAKLNLADAELAALEAHEAVNALIGLWGPGADWETADPLPDPPKDAPAMDDMEERAVAASLDLEKARASMEAIAAEAGVSNVTSLLPELEAGITAEKEAGESAWHKGPTWAMEVPLFDFGQARRRAAAVRLRQTWREYSATAADVRVSARTVRARLHTAHAKARYVDEVYAPLLRSVTHQTQLRYNGMLLGVFRLLETKRAELAATRRQIAARRDYWLAAADMDLLLAGVMPAMAGGRTDVGDGDASLPSGGGH